MRACGFLGGSAVKNLPANARDLVWFLSQENTLRRKWHPTPVFLPGKFHGQRSLVGCSPLGSQRVRHDLLTKSNNKSGSLDRISNLEKMILFHLGCYNKVAQAGWLRNNRNLLLTVREAGYPQSGCQNGWFCSRASSSLKTANFWLCPHRTHGVRELWEPLL